jgi:hypothetical protein
MHKILILVIILILLYILYNKNKSVEIIKKEYMNNIDNDDNTIIIGNNKIPLLDNHNNKTISYMMYPNCNLLNGDHGKTCKQTKGCYYDNNGCHFDWKHIY